MDMVKVRSRPINVAVRTAPPVSYEYKKVCQVGLARSLPQVEMQW